MIYSNDILENVIHCVIIINKSKIKFLLGREFGIGDIIFMKFVSTISF